jgi:hypothetical protein
MGEKKRLPPIQAVRAFAKLRRLTSTNAEKAFRAERLEAGTRRRAYAFTSSLADRFRHWCSPNLKISRRGA